VPYRGAGQSVTDLLAGQVQMIFETTAILLPHVQGGRLRALAVATQARSPLLPGVPTTAEGGYPKLVPSFWSGLLAPAGARPPPPSRSSTPRSTRSSRQRRRRRALRAWAPKRKSGHRMILPPSSPPKHRVGRRLRTRPASRSIENRRIRPPRCPSWLIK